MTIATLALLSLPLLSQSALAAQESDPDWERACALHCERDGFTIEVLASTVHSGSKLIFWPGTATHYVDAAHYQSGDHYFGYQSSSSPLAGGPYCTSYPGAAGHFIVGSVYERFLDYNWQYVETDSLSLSPDTACDGSMSWLLDTLELYGQGDVTLPASCSDIGCAGGDGGLEGDDPGTGTWEYTDASGTVQPLDGLGSVSGGSWGGSVERVERRR